MEFGRMFKVTPRSSGGGSDKAVLYVVGNGNPDEAMRLVRNQMGVGFKVEDVGRVSRQLLATLLVEPDQVKRI
jgi:hypothetical protein